MQKILTLNNITSLNLVKTLLKWKKLYRQSDNFRV